MNLDSNSKFAYSFADFSKLDIDDTDFTAVYAPTTGGYTIGTISTDVPLKYNPNGFAIEQNQHLYNVYGSINYLEQDRITTYYDLPKAHRDQTIGKLDVTPNLLFFNGQNEYYTSCDPIVTNSTLVGRTTVDSLTNDVRNDYIQLGEEVRDSIINGNACVQVEDQVFPKLESTTELKPISIYLKATGLEPNRDGFEVYLSGKKISSFFITRLNGTPAGFLTQYSLKSKANGEIEIQIDLDPGYVNLGCHLLELVSTNNYCATKLSIYNNFLNRIVINSLNNWSLNTHNEVASELLPKNNLPTKDGYLATYSNFIQTFQPTEIVFIDGIKLKLRSADINSEIKVFLFENEVDSDFPGRNLLAEGNASILLPSTSGLSWTDFEFEQPIILKPEKTYSFGVESNTGDIELYAAKVSDPDLFNPNSIVGNQLSIKGKLYRSLDNVNLELLEQEQLTFALTRAMFEDSTARTIDLGRYGTDEQVAFSTSFALNTRDIILNDTEIIYQYRFNTELTWHPFEVNLSNCFNQQVSDIYLKAIIRSYNKFVSPVISLPDSSVTLEINQTAGTILSKTESVEPYSHITVFLDVIQPVNTTIDITFNGNGLSSGWTPMLLDTTFNQTIDSALNINRIKYEFDNIIDVGPFLTYRIDLATTDVAVLPLVRAIYIFLK